MITTSDIITLDQVLNLAKRLPPIDQVRLIERLTPQIEHALEHATSTTQKPNDAWERMAQLREELAAIGADRLAGDQLDTDRRERQALIEGSGRVHD